MDIGLIGCQRSGTTLMGLILDSHPEVKWYGEPGQYHYWNEDRENTHNGYYLVTITQHPNQIRKDTNLIFMQRNVTDVVASMLNLGWVEKGKAGHEIKRILEEATGAYKEYILRRFTQFDYDHRMAALVTQLKFNYFDEYQKQGRTIHKVRYEYLVMNPEQEIKSMCNAIGLPFHEKMLHHDQLHKKFEAHGTKGNRKIDKSSINKSRLTLSKSQFDEVLAIASDVRDKYLEFSESELHNSQ